MGRSASKLQSSLVKRWRSAPLHCAGIAAAERRVGCSAPTVTPSQAASRYSYAVTLPSGSQTAASSYASSRSHRGEDRSRRVTDGTPAVIRLRVEALPTSVPARAGSEDAAAGFRNRRGGTKYRLPSAIDGGSRELDKQPGAGFGKSDEGREWKQCFETEQSVLIRISFLEGQKQYTGLSVCKFHCLSI